MDHDIINPLPTEPPPEGSPPRRREDLGPFQAAALLGALSLVTLAFCLAYRSTLPFGPGQDPFDYVTTARHLVRSGSLRFPIETPARLGLDARYNAFFIPEPYVLAPDGRHFVPATTAGTSILMAGWVLLLGEEVGPYVCGPVAGALAIVMTFFVARRWFGHVESLLAAALLACSPVFLAPARAPLSDVPALLWALATLAVLVRSSGSAGHALAGLIFGFTLLVRLQMVVVLPALLVGIAGLAPFPRREKNLLGFILGLVPMLALQGFLNLSLYGSPFTNGYALLPTMTRPFTLEAFPVGLARYMLALLTGLGPVTLALAAYAAVRGRGKLAPGAILWVGGIIVFFSFFRYSGRIPLQRYILAAFPVIIFAALVPLARLSDPRRRLARAALMAGAVLTLAVMFPRYNLLRPYSVDQYVKDVDLARVAAFVGRDAAVFSQAYCGRLAEEQGVNAINWSRGTATVARELLVDLIDSGRPVYLLDTSAHAARAVIWLGENVSSLPLHEEGVRLYRLGRPLPSSKPPERTDDRMWLFR